MRVLITSELSEFNPYMQYLHEGMHHEANITFDIDSFWETDLHFDIIHIHWPEHIAGYRMDNVHIAEEFEARLQYWKIAGARLVITRHNYVPHMQEYGLQQKYEKMYDDAYRYSDAIIHIGNASYQEFNKHEVYSKNNNVIINHPNYLVGVPNEVSRENAREKLRIKRDDALFLSFGILRNIEEELQLINAFLRLAIKHKKLLITRSYICRTRPTKQHLFKRLKFEMQKRRYISKGIVFDQNDTIDMLDVQLYMNAADVVISSRITNLTSGVVYMGYSFGRVVVAPNIGNIGELLSVTSNPSFIPKDTESLSNAMAKGFVLSKTQLPKDNYKYVKENCDIYELGKQYITLFKKLIGSEPK